MNGRHLLVVAGAIALTAAPVFGQVDRASLLDQARVEPDNAIQLRLLLSAANPSTMDSVWAASVYEIAQIVRDREQGEVAEAWLRWAVRHGRPWPLDSAWISPTMFPVFDSVLGSVAEDTRNEVGTAGTDWQWPDEFSIAENGVLEVRSDAPEVDVQVRVEGVGVWATGESRPLAPGSYELIVDVEGFESIRVWREVLPGVSTRVSFTMLPTLSEGVSQRVESHLVALRHGGAASTVCTNGLVWRDARVVLTSLSGLQDTSELEVLWPDGTVEAGTISEEDAASDLAVLTVPEGSPPSILAAGPEDVDFAWPVFRTGCNQRVDAARMRVMRSDETGMLSLDGSPPPAAVGAPLVNHDGDVIGLVVREGRVVELGRAEPLVDDVLEDLDSGFPVLWVTAGVVIAAGVAALVIGGGSDEEATGGIVIAIPIG